MLNIKVNCKSSQLLELGENEATVRQKIGSPAYVDFTDNCRFLFYQLNDKEVLILFFEKNEIDIYSLRKIRTVTVNKYKKNLFK